MSPFRLSLVLAAAAALTACGDDEDGAARLRVGHFSPDAPAVDVLVNNTQVLTNVSYTQASSYLDALAGSANIQVRAAGTTTTVINATATLAEDTDYTVLAVNRLAQIEPLVLEDDNTPPAAGQAHVRVVHGASTAPAVDVYVTAPGANINTATPTLTNVPFKGVSAYLPVPAGTYQVRVTPTGTKTVVIDVPSFVLTAGQIRTVVARENAGAATFGVTVLSDLN